MVVILLAICGGCAAQKYGGSLHIRDTITSDTRFTFNIFQSEWIHKPCSREDALALVNVIDTAPLVKLPHRENEDPAVVFLYLDWSPKDNDFSTHRIEFNRDMLANEGVFTYEGNTYKLTMEGCRIVNKLFQDAAK